LPIRADPQITFVGFEVVLLTAPRIVTQTTGRVEMRYEKTGLVFVLVFSFIAVVPSLASAELSLNLGLGVAIT
jgi:hypothetical protein